jgi:hypothetical protein
MWSTDFLKILKYQMSRIPIHWESSGSMRMDRNTWRSWQSQFAILWTRLTKDCHKDTSVIHVDNWTGNFLNLLCSINTHILFLSLFLRPPTAILSTVRPRLHWSQNRHNTANQHLSGHTSPDMCGLMQWHFWLLIAEDFRQKPDALFLRSQEF